MLSAIHRKAAFLPPAHGADEDVQFIRKLLADSQLWVAETDGAVVGYVAFDEAWLRHLFVHPDYQGRGLGTALLEHALADRKERQLWTFERNTPARAFYERHGWVLVELTDGSGNDEHEPEVRYVWRPQSS